MPEKETPNFKFPSPTSVGEVKLGATNIEELANSLDTFLAGKILIFKSYAVAASLKAGELAEQTKAGETFTLPVATTANRVIGVYGAATCKVTTSGGAFIIGDFITAASKTATITLTEGQHVVLMSNGTNWIIIAGEPKREQKYPAQSQSVVSPTIQEPSATRPATVVLEMVHFGGTSQFNVNVGGVAIGHHVLGNETQNRAMITFPVNPGQKWECAFSGGSAPEVFWTTLLQ
jgi:hypothetical protein